jgi:hypothetical protein
VIALPPISWLQQAQSLLKKNQCQASVKLLKAKLSNVKDLKIIGLTNWLLAQNYLILEEPFLGLEALSKAHHWGQGLANYWELVAKLNEQLKQYPKAIDAWKQSILFAT